MNKIIVRYGELNLGYIDKEVLSVRERASLVLESGEIFHGYSFGYGGDASGEVVFGTSMVGYPENLTDPSYEGQILVASYPLVGNYGVPEETVADGLSRHYESERIHVRALVVSEHAGAYSHWNAKKSLGRWLRENGIPGLCGVDTRELTKIIRERGVMRGKIVRGDNPRHGEAAFAEEEERNLVADAGCKEVIRYGEEGNGRKTVVLADYGVKHNILRCLLERQLNVVRVPWNYDFSAIEHDGLLLSNGPGDPDRCADAVRHISRALTQDRPIFGICMGSQLLAKAAGARTYKLKYGHRGHNQPVRRVGDTKCFITSQNHGYAVDDATLPREWKPFFTNMNDGTNEGIIHESKPFFSVQFHPEASSGPTDTAFLFDEFIAGMGD